MNDILCNNLYPYKVKYIVNPSQKKLRELSKKHSPNVLTSSCKNLNKISRNKARMAKWSYIIAKEEDKNKYSSNIIDPQKASGIIDIQRKYIEDSGYLIEIQGYLGIGEKAVPIQFLYTLDTANIAGMQQVLLFSRKEVEDKKTQKLPFRPELRLVYTAECKAGSMPGEQAIIVDLESYTSYVIGPDYFGESKKGALRMLNDFMYKKGGLVLHAGAKMVSSGGQDFSMAILGLSGTGKTTTTFSKQGNVTKPIQDDMVTLWKDGIITITENGCFAKTHGLTLESEPIIYKGTIKKTAWVENVYQDKKGNFDFLKETLTPEEAKDYRDIFVFTGTDPTHVDDYISKKVKVEEIIDENGIPKDGWDFTVWTQNGRSIIPMSSVENRADFHNIPPVKFLGILNRDEGPDAATPGIVKFASHEQAAGYFMLGETSKTSAAGKERGKTRSPFTQPFFPQKMSLQADRFKELLATMPDVTTWLMNTGFIGGEARDVEKNTALKVKIRHSSAMLEALITDKVKWIKDPDFGYYIVDINAEENKQLLEIVPVEIVNPIKFFEKNNRMDTYKKWVETLNTERKAFLEKFNVSEEIIRSVVGGGQ